MSANYSDDAFDSSHSGTYFDGSLGHTFDAGSGILSSPGVSAGAGYYTFDRRVFGPDTADSYWNWNAGAFVDIVDFTLDVRYYDTNGDGESLFGTKGAGSSIHGGRSEGKPHSVSTSLPMVCPDSRSRCASATLAKG